MKNEHKHKYEIDAFLFVIIAMCLFSGVVMLLPENFGTPHGRTQARFFLGALLLLCIPGLLWVRKLINSK